MFNSCNQKSRKIPANEHILQQSYVAEQLLQYTYSYSTSIDGCFWKKSNNQRNQITLLFHITLSTFSRQICVFEDFLILFCPMHIMFHVSLCLMHICVDKFHRIIILDFMVCVGQQLDSSSCERWFKISRTTVYHISFVLFGPCIFFL